MLNALQRFLKVTTKLPAFRRTLVLHNSRYTENIPPHILIPMLCWPNRNRFRRPSNLAILLVHNRDYKTLLEQSLDYLGIEGYSLVQPRVPPGGWRQTLKIASALNFARNCAQEYILYIDSDDAMLIGDPQRAIRLLQDSGGGILYSTTSYSGYYFTPELKAWFRQLADDAGWSRCENVYINSGVYVARRECLIELLEAASEYVADSAISEEERKKKFRNGMMPEFPRGVRSEQVIIRFVSPRFARRLRLDYASKLAIR